VADHAHDELGSGLQGDRRARLGLCSEREQLVDDDAGVGAVVDDDVADSHRHLEAHIDTGRERLRAEPLVQLQGRQCGGRCFAEHGDRAIAFVHRHHDAPAFLADDVVANVAQPRHGDAHLVGLFPPQATRVRDFGRQ
jgi:hypothetical protein